MAEKDVNTAAEQNVENVQDTLSRGEQFIEKNQRMLIYVGVGILVIIAGYFLYRNYLKSQDVEAQAQMFNAERSFEADSFKVALEGDGNLLGFEDIIADYGSTKSANLAHYYAGVSNLHLGNYDKAIEHLDDFSANDVIMSSLKYSAMGDAYLEKGDLEKAVSNFKKAATTNPNDFSTPIYLMKAGLACEELKNYDEALKMYQAIKRDYARSSEGQSIDKYIARVEVKAGK